MIPAFRNALINASTRLSLNPPPHPVQNGRVRELIETRLDVALNDPLVTARGCGEEVNLGDRVLRPASWPVPVGAGLEVGLEDRLQHQLEGGLNHAVAQSGHPESTAFPAALGYVALLDRQRPEAPRAQLLTEPVEERLHAQHLLDVAGGLPVHTSRA